ncbi:hypothetical protein SAMN05443245_3398 [Paraburkholderia fungorum]|uniref:Uncharacterized protein n=1 Tax=Paraburkholderia fungorum TaxID=134537 RepID=A0A1H1GZ98_9BURK|nr:hypothetical protein [Paraburkholderia fungorum]SDR18507.1 hypothetical protein SAMN05443245_3398 [Paraburkholderia fungorum]
MLDDILGWLGLLLFLGTFVALRMVQAAKKADAADPYLSGDFEYECDAPYPRFYE